MHVGGKTTDMEFRDMWWSWKERTEICVFVTRRNIAVNVRTLVLVLNFNGGSAI
jgi:hypothetical protein